MIRGVRWSAIGAIVCLLGACRSSPSEPAGGTDSTKSASSATGATSSATAATTASPGAISDAAPLALNDSAVMHYADETKIAPATLLATRRPSPVRTQASLTEGDLVSDLPSGTGVVRIAQRDPFFLALFDDPRDPSRQLMGWLHRDSFLPDPNAKHVPVNCPTGQIPILRAEQEVCVAVCTVDSQCSNGTCSGHGVRSNNGKPGESTKYCEPKVVPLYDPSPAPSAAPKAPSKGK